MKPQTRILTGATPREVWGGVTARERGCPQGQTHGNGAPTVGGTRGGHQRGQDATLPGLCCGWAWAQDPRLPKQDLRVQSSPNVPGFLSPSLADGRTPKDSNKSKESSCLKKKKTQGFKFTVTEACGKDSLETTLAASPQCFVVPAKPLHSSDSNHHVSPRPRRGPWLCAFWALAPQ